MLVLELLALHQLVIQRPIGPAVEVLAADQGFVRARREGDLSADRHAIDGIAIAGRGELVDPAEEFKAHAALAQQLVERRRDDVAGSRAHLPEDGAAVERELDERQQHGAGRDVASFRDVAAGIGEDQVVERPQDGRILGEM